MTELIKLGGTNNLRPDEQDFFNAAKSGNKKVLRRFVESARIPEVDIKNELGQTPLFFACLEGNAECVKYLLEAGADSNEYV